MTDLLLFRQDSPGPQEASVYQPVFCLILQGRKVVSIGDRTLSVGSGECLLVTHDLPVLSRITRAPYLSLVFTVDIAAVRTLSDDAPAGTFDHERARPAEVHTADPEMLDAMCRYLTFADVPADARVLGPLVSKEIHYRLLTAPFGAMLRRLTSRDSQASAIARAIGHIRRDLRSAVVIPDLARRVGMSVSAFHKNFKAITATTPLQYQKEPRLREAQRLLKECGAAVTVAAYDVGYQSVSQFRREYARRFGMPPSREIVRQRHRGIGDLAVT